MNGRDNINGTGTLLERQSEITKDHDDNSLKACVLHIFAIVLAFSSAMLFYAFFFPFAPLSFLSSIEAANSSKHCTAAKVWGRNAQVSVSVQLTQHQDLQDENLSKKDWGNPGRATLEDCCFSNNSRGRFLFWISMSRCVHTDTHTICVEIIAKLIPQTICLRNVIINSPNSFSA